MATHAFGRFVVDARHRSLCAAGAPVELQGRPFEILLYLIESRDRAVTMDEIMARVWRGRIVSRNNVTVQISALRRTLAEHGGTDLILTRSDGRYQFVADVTEIAEREPVSPSPPAVAPIAAADLGAGARLPRLFVLMGVAATVLLGVGWEVRRWAAAPPAPPRLSIAVLPFRNLSADRSQDFLADAISDDLTTDLAHIPGSVVIAQESSGAYRNKAVQTALIGRALGVRYLLEGSLRAEDGALWMNAQLIDAPTGAHLWAERFAARLDHVGETRNAIVRRIASALDARLTDLEAARAADERPNNADALGLFFRARRIVEHDDRQVALTDAQHALEQAVAAEPRFADALAELGLVLIQKIRSADDPDNAHDEAEARDMIAQALLIAPHNATALAADARLHEMDNNCTATLLSADAALAQEPNNVDALSMLAKCAFAAGDLEAAAARTQTVLEVNPEGRSNKPRYVMLAEIRLLQGRLQEAIDHAYQAIAGDAEPRAGAEGAGRAEFCRLMLIAAYQLSGDQARASGLYQDYAQVWPNRSTWRIAAYAPRRIAIMPGYKRFMAALEKAGMRPFADEHVVTAVVPLASSHDGRDFDETPVRLPGPVAQTIDTAGVAAMLAQGHPIILDVGRGAAVIDGAAWNARIGTDCDDLAFAKRTLAARTGGNLDAPIILMASGVYGFDSYNLGLQVMQLGYRKVYWYRGGEEAWAASGRPAQDLRLQ